ncbi:CE1759 family FMN reductase [Kribbella sancticallisti]|uniref:CE1759 family FMN reductase n=1 Tax=Kribbella sancticallisti TaxID=460087 RepID=UPI0031DB843E
MNRTITVLTSGLRRSSATRVLADNLARATCRELNRLGATVDLDLIEVREHGHALVDSLTNNTPSAELDRALESVARADGLIAVTPTFTASYNGMFKMFIEVLDDTALVGKPVLIGATGGTGRHQLVLDHQMRPLFSNLYAVVLPTGIFAGPDDWAAEAVVGTALGHRIDRAAAELAWEIDRRSECWALRARGDRLQ